MYTSAEVITALMYAMNAGTALGFILGVGVSLAYKLWSE